MTSRALASLLILACAAACARDDDAADPLAGAGLPSYTVDTTPTLVLADDGTPEKLFQHVSARRLPERRMAVADHGALTINVFGRDGTFDTTLARRGGGPGELQGDFFFTSHTDTLFVLGRPMMSRGDVSIFVVGQGFLRRFRPEADDAPTGMVLHDRLATGQFVVERGRGFKVLSHPPELGTLTPDSVTYGLLSVSDTGASGAVVWLSPVVRGWGFAHLWPGSRIGTGSSRYTLGPTTQVVASGDRVWLVSTDSARLRAFDGSGRPVVDTRLPLQPRPYDPAELERAHARALAAATRALDTAKANGLYDPQFLPATAPLFSAAHAGSDGELWLQLFAVDDTAPPRYLVVDRDGRLIARATLPAGLDVQQIGRDFVLGVRRDSLDVESVVEYALRRE